MSAATYDEFERVLRDSRALQEPAEAHGTLAGALCSSRDYGLHRVAARDPARRLAGRTQRCRPRCCRTSTTPWCARWPAVKRTSQPLLPDDEAPLADRADALSQWCQGFLYGLGSGTASDPGKVSSRGRRDHPRPHRDHARRRRRRRAERRERSRVRRGGGVRARRRADRCSWSSRRPVARSRRPEPRQCIRTRRRQSAAGTAARDSAPALVAPSAATNSRAAAAR